jgi:hypothetical protein
VGCLSAGTEPRDDTAAASSSTAGELPQAQTFAQAAGKRALVIAIGDYPNPNVNGYRRINSANDVPLVQAALRAQGFAVPAIRTVTNAEADRAGILRALDQLVEASRPGDVVVVHYSGHGDQLTDDNGDEIDGYDEVLVPHGAPSNEYFKKQYGAAAAARAAEYARERAGFKHVRDDELQTYLTRLREKVGPRGNVVFSIDSCHSGTGTRGDAGPMPRGPDEPIGLPADGARSGSGTADEAGLFEGAGASAALAPYVVLSASRQGEKDWETRDEDSTPVGPLSLALSRTLPTVRPGESYQALFDRVAALMSSLAPNQMPQIEGDASTEVFSGRAVPYEPYYRVTQINERGRPMLAGGQLTGLSRGSRVAFFPIGGSPAAGRPLAQGTVEVADATESRVIVDAGVAPTVDLKQTWAFITEAAFGDLAVDVYLDAALGASERNAIVTALKAKGLVRIVDDPGRALLAVGRDVTGASASSPAIAITTAVDRARVGEPIRGQAVAELVRDRVEDYARNRYLKGITLTSSEVNVRLTIVPAAHQYTEDVRGNQVCAGSNTAERGRARQHGSADRTWELAEGDGFLIELHNVGKRPAHVAVLELYPDGRIGQMFPAERLQMAEARLEPGQRALVRDLCFTVTPPVGNYTYKLFATDASDKSSRPIDFRPVLTRERTVSRGDMGPFAQLLDSTYATTRTGTTTVAVNSGSTDQIHVKVVAR